MTAFAITMRVVCTRCGVVDRVPAFVRGRSWPWHCGAPMRSPGAAEVRIADAAVALGRALAAAAG